jgi:hypothetical protein
MRGFDKMNIEYFINLFMMADMQGVPCSPCIVATKCHMDTSTTGSRLPHGKEPSPNDHATAKQEAFMPGIHHVTALAGDAAANLAFYRNVLGLRLVKTTINFDDPGIYHLYFGNGAGEPGTILTFFPHGHAARGKAGPGQAVETAFAIPPASMAWCR